MSVKYPDLTEIDALKLSKEISEFEYKKDELDKQLTELLRNDPETIARISAEMSELKTAANIWTDNIFILRQFVCSKMGISEAYVNEALQIPADLDLLEL